MTIKILLFVILLFATLCYVCYNYIIKTLIERNLSLQTNLRETMTQVSRFLNENLQDLTQEVKDLKDPEIIDNEKNLEELLQEEATEKDYEKFIDGITEAIQDLYKNYQFIRQDPDVNDVLSGYFLGFKFIRMEYPKLFESLFRLAVDKSMDPNKIQEKFIERVQAGKVIPLGNVVIYGEGSTQIGSILQGESVPIVITFAPEEYDKKRTEYLESQEEEQKKRQEEQEEMAKQKDEALKSLRQASAVLDKLSEDVAEKYDMKELMEEIKKGLGRV